MRKNKSKKELTTVDYVEFEKSYCNKLEPKLRSICGCSFSSKVTVPMLKNYVARIVAPARKTEKYGEFITNLYACKDKKSIYLYCRNSVRKARETIVEVAQ